CAVPPFEIGNPPTEVAGVEIEPDRGWVICQPFNFTGHPVGNVPVDITDDGLPIGLQLVGRKHADETVVAASAALERANPWIDTYPAR
ncbi:MAG: amidase family protein, partial [Halobacteriales archaeon]|nr:amidase family protein [Halobacteriales archaeon]